MPLLLNLQLLDTVLCLPYTYFNNRPAMILTVVFSPFLLRTGLILEPGLCCVSYTYYVTNTLLKLSATI